eukprot:363620-Chlamydomonas_euryale.AAC.3
MAHSTIKGSLVSMHAGNPASACASSRSLSTESTVPGFAALLLHAHMHGQCRGGPCCCRSRWRMHTVMGEHRRAVLGWALLPPIPLAHAHGDGRA